MQEEVVKSPILIMVVMLRVLFRLMLEQKGGRGHSCVAFLPFRRIALGLTQEEAAQEMCVDPSTLAHWEQGKHNPNAEAS